MSSTTEETVIAQKEAGELTKETPEEEGLLGRKTLDTFVYMEDTKAILDVAIQTEENAILYGPGGYGKSEYALAFLEDKGIAPYVFTMGSGTTTDRLFGGLDIPVFNSTGKIEYLVENSFMNHEYVIFEELFDAPDFILEQLKDILSAGVFRNGSQVFEIKTKTIICCTNRTREEFSKNASLKALMERFPLELKVVWKDHTKINYEHLFNAKFGGSDPMLTYILEQYAIAGQIISPRIAIKSANIIRECGPDALKYIADFSLKPDVLKNAVTKFGSIKEIHDKMVIMNEYVAKFKKINLNTLEGVKEATKTNLLLHTELTKLKSIKADDSMVAMVTDAVKQFTTIYTKNKKDIELIMAMGDDTPMPSNDDDSITLG